MRILALNENYQCWGWDGGLARIGPKGILPRIGCRSRFGVVLARRHRSCGLLRRPERHRHRRVSYRERAACGPPYSQVYAEGTGRLDDHVGGYRCQRQYYLAGSSSDWRSHYGLVLHRRYDHHRHRALRFNGSLEEMNCIDKAECIPVQYPLTDKNTPFMRFSLLRNSTSISNQLRRKIAIYQQE